MFDKGFKQRSSIVPLVARLTRREGELRRARADILELQGLREQDAEEMQGVREDASVSKAGFDEERETREKAEADRDEAHRQLEFLEGELEGVRASERALIEEGKTLRSDLTATAASRDAFEAESRRAKDLNVALDVEASGLRKQLEELRDKHAAALDDARRYRADAERQGERAGKLAAAAASTPQPVASGHPAAARASLPTSPRPMLGGLRMTTQAITARSAVCASMKSLGRGGAGG